SENSRENFNQIAIKLGNSPVTIKKHIEELEQKGIIKGYGVQIDFEKLGYDIIATIEITVSKGKMIEVETDIAENPNVFGVYDITGDLQTKESNNIIILKTVNNEKQLNHEGYTLIVSKDRIEIGASTPNGVFYGIQTMQQLIPLESIGNKNLHLEFSIPCVVIEDHP
ncbi:unnamed protein product, partial [marine sediment metagenome]